MHGNISTIPTSSQCHPQNHPFTAGPGGAQSLDRCLNSVHALILPTDPTEIEPTMSAVEGRQLQGLPTLHQYPSESPTISGPVDIKEARYSLQSGAQSTGPMPILTCLGKPAKGTSGGLL